MRGNRGGCEAGRGAEEGSREDVGGFHDDVAGVGWEGRCACDVERAREKESIPREPRATFKIEFSPHCGRPCGEHRRPPDP